MPSFSRQIRLFSGLEAPLREQIYGKIITAQVMPQFSQCSRVAICSCTTTDTLRLDTIRASLQKVTASDGRTCRVDVVCVGADLRVRPQNRLRSGEDGRTHRSAPTVEAPTPTSGSPKRSQPSLRNEKNFAFYLHMNLESKGLHVQSLHLLG